ncbi:MAG: YgjV family protein [Ignavibacteriales bacterium]|nr:YgjV family protein [Ignavibacteriales bacterium]
MLLPELLGYLGSVFIAVSLWMTNIRKLRLLNMTGAGMLAVYGLIIQAYPVLVLNAFNVCVNIFFLRQISKRQDYFTLLPLPEVKTAYLEKFLIFYQKDIKKYFPEFSWKKLHQPNCFFVLRNLIPVGLFIYETQQAAIIDIKLDYVIPDYRDFKNASFTYSTKKEELKRQGFTTFQVHTTVKEHQQYLNRIGFIQDIQEASLFRREI